MVRRMGEFEVYQRTKDGYFSATKLLKQWNHSNKQSKEVKEFLRNDGTKTFIEELKNDEDYNGDNSPYLSARGKNGGTWMHPYLFIKFAMWMNPKFELQVIKFVHDQLIEFRHDAGDNYRELCSAVQMFDNCNYPNLARALNYTVFGKHCKELRQTATEAQLNELQTIQKHLAFSVNTGLIKSFDHLLEHLRMMWAIRWNRGE